jgi:hypothetical protein
MPKGIVTPELIIHLLAQPEFGDLRIDHKEIDVLVGTGRPISYADFVTEIFDLYGKTQGKALVGNKTPGFVRRLRTIHTLWPEARFVHLIRDGRDVHLSTLHRSLKHPKPGVFDNWKDYPATTAALWWELNIRAGRQAGQSFGPNLYHEIRYESLVNNPEQECTALCDFLGLPFDDAMLRFYERETRPRAARPITSGLRDWRSQMPSADAERFEAAVGDLLDELGYPRAFPHPLAEGVELASRIRETLARDPRTRYEAERQALRGSR